MRHLRIRRVEEKESSVWLERPVKSDISLEGTNESRNHLSKYLVGGKIFRSVTILVVEN